VNAEPVTRAEVAAAVERVLRYQRHGDDRPDDIADLISRLWERHVTQERALDTDQERRLTDALTGIGGDVDELRDVVGQVLENSVTRLDAAERAAASMAAKAEAAGKEIDLEGEITEVRAARQGLRDEIAGLREKLAAQTGGGNPPAGPAPTP
jgi:chromosome segregation ATPase